ncbi:hypothetical protein NM688_g3941 [Phlebia brevispora]|uniref:Uncharacterized protein n=1 Tax=Phlebia brevispora TaxID=194682 RepID=A0ACC1T4N9_9APHY|nr:hypothetical protein NM688_g3941 [Phlebia brevispora]
MSKHSVSRTGSQTAAMSAAASGTVSASTQSGRASQNFAVVLGAFVRAFENGDIFNPGLKNTLDGLRLSLADECYDVVDFSFADDLHEWTTSAIKVYSLKTQEEIDAYQRKDVRTDPDMLIGAQAAALLDGAPANFLRNTKNWALFEQEAPSTLCLAIRGTTLKGFECLVDAVMNMDAEQEETVLTGIETPFQSHKGFLDGAKDLLAPVCIALEKAISQKQTKPVLILSGHSAGGGTALLLYHLLQTEKHEMVEMFSAIHCFTFGSAAIASIPNPTHITRTRDRIVSFVNLGDLVPRTDLAYASWIADTVGKYLARATSNNTSDKLSYKPLPKQKLFPGGELVLMDGTQDLGIIGTIQPRQLEGVAFLDIEAHKGTTYAELVTRLLPLTV